MPCAWLGNSKMGCSMHVTAESSGCHVVDEKLVYLFPEKCFGLQVDDRFYKRGKETVRVGEDSEYNLDANQLRAYTAATQGQAWTDMQESILQEFITANKING